jgi:hypothetical protein
MGAPFMRHFLADYIGNDETGIAWKNKHVRFLIGVNGIYDD